MSMRKTVGCALLILLLGFIGRGNAEPIFESEMFPDIPGVEKSVWHCDEGATPVAAYITQNEWRRTIIMTGLRPYAIESKQNGQTHYFVLSPDGAKFLEISFEQFKSDMEFLSPNYVKYLRGEPNDCVDSTSLRQGM